VVKDHPRFLREIQTKHAYSAGTNRNRMRLEKDQRIWREVTAIHSRPANYAGPQLCSKFQAPVKQCPLRPAGVVYRDILSDIMSL
jgi:hypothetical protein